MNRSDSNQLDMRYASPGYIRPNQDLIEKTKRNFSWDKFRTKHNRPPSPNLLPMPPVQWQKKTIPAATTSNLDENVKIIKGKNRTWKISAVARGFRNRKRMKTKKKNKSRKKYKKKLRR